MAWSWQDKVSASVAAAKGCFNRESLSYSARHCEPFGASQDRSAVAQSNSGCGRMTIEASHKGEFTSIGSIG